MSLQDRINNAKSALADAKIRMIVMILVAIVIITLVITYVKFKRTQLPPTELLSSVTKAPEITSIPGVGQPTREYAKLQEQQNLELAEEAARKGTSAIPTVVRTTYLDVGVSSEAGGASAGGCSSEDLTRARSAGVSASELRCRGCSLAALKNSGFTAGELKNTGFNADALRAVGFSEEEIKIAGLNSTNLSSSGECSLQKVQDARRKGTSATALKELGCSLAILKAAGYTAAELKAAGFSAGELRDAGFSAAELKAAGFSAEDLRKAGFSAAELKDAGFTADELRAAGFTDGDLVRTGLSVESAGEKKSAAPDLNSSVAQLKAKGYSESEIKDAILKVIGGTTVAVAPKTPEEEKIGRLTKEQLANMTTQELDDFLRQLQATMRQQANELFTAWSQIPMQQYVQGEKPTQAAGGPTVAGGPAGGAGIAIAQNVDVYKAGTILFAVLDAEVNSDENTPVMATVIQGPLKNSKLLGNFQRVDKKVLLQFNVLAVPALTKSISVNAVAIDPNTARTALASNVDNHYMLRYGTLLASSFVGGLADAMQTSGGQIQTTTVGTTTVFPKIDFMQQLAVALGKVGKDVGTATAKNINTPPTVKVNAGASIGLLLISDLSVPKTDKEVIKS